MKINYSKIFSIQGEGIHKYRIFGIGIIDILLTIALAIFTSKFLEINFTVALVLWFVIGELAHIIFGVQTAFLSLIK